MKKAIEILKDSHVINLFLDSEVLLANILKKDRVYILTHRERIVGKDVFDEFIKLVNKRKEGYPLQ